jgi:hypothetical protein
MTAGAGALRSIFVAPEFLFTQPEQGHVGTSALDTDSRDWILNSLKSMSGRCHGMLLVPGTIVYKKAVTQRTAEHAADRLTHARDWAKPGKHKLSTPSPKPYATYETRKRDTEGYKEYYSEQLARTKQLARGETLDPAEQNMVVTNPKAQSFFIRNKTYVFFDGEVKLRYGKKTNMDDFHDDKVKGIFIPGKNEGVVTLANRKVGFEICLDHSLGLLKDHLNTTDLDLHIIASAEVPNETTNFCAKPGGFVIHASSNPDCSGVFRRVAKGKEGNPILTFKPVPKGEKPEAVLEGDERLVGTFMGGGQDINERGELVKVEELMAKVKKKIPGWDNIEPFREVEIGGGPLRLYRIDL